jgi:hypothetical protein
MDEVTTSREDDGRARGVAAGPIALCGHGRPHVLGHV